MNLPNNKFISFILFSFFTILLYLNLRQSGARILIRLINYAYFDLGANRGDTVYKFLQNQVINETQLKDVQWNIYAFEPNPRFTSDLIAMKENVSKTHKVNLYNDTAAWTHDGYVSFYLELISNFSEGSSLLKEHPFVSKDKNLTVRCVDVAKLIKQYDKEDFVVVKIDIEGAEYDLLLHFIKENVMPLIDYLIVEFHKNDGKKFTQPEDVYKSLIQLYGVKFKEWY